MKSFLNLSYLVDYFSLLLLCAMGMDSFQIMNGPVTRYHFSYKVYHIKQCRLPSPFTKLNQSVLPSQLAATYPCIAKLTPHFIHNISDIVQYTRVITHDAWDFFRMTEESSLFQIFLVLILRKLSSQVIFSGLIENNV